MCIDQSNISGNSRLTVRHGSAYLDLVDFYFLLGVLEDCIIVRDVRCA